MLPLSIKHSIIAAICVSAFAAHAESAHEFPFLPMNDTQEAAVGIRNVKIQNAQTAQILANAQVIPQPGKDVTISAAFAGHLSKITASIGDKVKAGDLLAEFTSGQLADAHRQWLEAKLEMQNAQSALQRDEAMLSEGIIPAVRVQLTRSKFEIAQANFLARESELKSAGLDVSKGSQFGSAALRSPISGTITQTYAQIGQRVEAGTTLYRIADDSALQLDIQLSSEKANAVRAGDLVQIDAKGAQAKILGVSRAADASQSAKARALVQQRGYLNAGEWVNVTIQTRASNDSTTARWRVPARSITHFENQTLIFVKQEKGYMPHAVQLISSNDDSALIEANLPNDTRIAAQGIISLRAMLQKDE